MSIVIERKPEGTAIRVILKHLKGAFKGQANSKNFKQLLFCNQTEDSEKLKNFIAWLQVIDSKGALFIFKCGKLKNYQVFLCCMFFNRSSKFCKIKTAATESTTRFLFLRDKSADKSDLSAATVVSLSSQNVMGRLTMVEKFLAK